MEFDAFLHDALPPLGFNWRPHRRRAVRKKILGRLRELHLCRLEDYLQLLHDSADEQSHFEQLLPVTVSRFFRNHHYYTFLRVWDLTACPSITGTLTGAGGQDAQIALCAPSGSKLLVLDRGGSIPGRLTQIWHKKEVVRDPLRGGVRSRLAPSLLRLALRPKGR